MFRDRRASLIPLVSVFLYSVPGSGSKIKERMVYASCKESVISNIEEKFGVKIERKVTTGVFC